MTRMTGAATEPPTSQAYRCRTEAVIPAPLDAVWDALADLAEWARWWVVVQVEALDPERLGVAGSSPSELVAGEELLREFRRRLSEEEQRLADLRAGGHAWADIAAQMGGTPDARRQQLDRAVSRVSRELGLEVDNDE